MFRIGLAGLGTVGCGVIDIIQRMQDSLTQRTGREIVIAGVSARNKSRERPVDISGYQWFDNPMDMAQHDNIDCVVEMIGGESGISLDLCKASLSNKKHVVTANKAMIAHHAESLFTAAQNNNVSFGFEAAVAGGIPAIKTLRESLAGNAIKEVAGILNGTCNYILTEMSQKQADFQTVLAEAQALGYAESDPSFDIEGKDAAHKLSILVMLAFGRILNFDDMRIKGITKIALEDIQYAEDLGYVIKLLGLARHHGNFVEARVEPFLLPYDAQMATVDGVFNAVHYAADPVDTITTIGRGAGAGPTASAILSDIVDIARNAGRFNLQQITKDNGAYLTQQETLSSRFYVRLNVIDQPGVIADITAIFRDLKISLESVIQMGHDAGQAVNIVMILHETSFEDTRKAMEQIGALQAVLDAPQMIPIAAF